MYIDTSHSFILSQFLATNSERMVLNWPKVNWPNKKDLTMDDFGFVRANCELNGGDEVTGCVLGLGRIVWVFERNLSIEPAH
jgi:hypothetical protein